MAAKTQPSVLVFELADVADGEFRATKAKVSERVRARPFYLFDGAYQTLYEQKVEKSPDLPADTKLPAAEDKRGYAFLNAVINGDFATDGRSLKLLRVRRDGRLNCYMGWHNTAGVADLRRAFSSAGFQVLAMADLFSEAASRQKRDKSAGSRSNVTNQTSSSALPARRFEFKKGSSSKFWSIERRARRVTVRFGRIGSTGQENTKAFSNDQKAADEERKLIAEKLGKGYREVSAPERTPPPSTAKEATRTTAAWSAEVQRELTRLGITTHPFEQKAVAAMLETKQRVPRAIAAFAAGVERPHVRFGVSARPFGWLSFLRPQMYELEIAGEPRQLVSFAYEDSRSHLCFDARDTAKDPSIWRLQLATRVEEDTHAALAHDRLSQLLATLCNGSRASGATMPPWSKAVTRELRRLDAVILPFDRKAPRPLGIGNSFWDAKRKVHWDDVDPRGQVTAVPPAIFAFFESVDFRTRKLVLHKGKDGTEELKIQTSNEHCDVTLKGRRHLLVGFASDDSDYNYCLDFCDTDPDPAVWRQDHESCYEAYPEFEKLSGFLAAITPAEE